MHARDAEVPPHVLARGRHTERDSPWLFVDGCAQIRDDTGFDAPHRHTPTASVVTAFRPQARFETAVEADGGAGCAPRGATAERS
jgi:hypothetical protein